MCAVDTQNERNDHGSGKCPLEIAKSSCVDIIDKAESRRKAGNVAYIPLTNWESPSVLYQRGHESRQRGC